MNILFVGDVVGKIGRNMLHEHLPALKRQHGLDLIVVNGENTAGGVGITPAIAEELFDLGVGVITLGNHAWDKRDVIPYIDGEKRLLRPLNWPGAVPGGGSVVVQAANGARVGVICLIGRVFAHVHYDDPFRAVDQALEQISGRADVILVEMHADATSEKAAMGWYLDGRVSAVLGSHTHVQTADNWVLPGGTAYLTDLGMTGPYHSVIGMEKDLVLERFLTQMPVRFETAKGPGQLCGAVIQVDPQSGRAHGIERVFIRQESGE